MMNLREYLKNSKNEIITPAYYFDIDVFERRINYVKHEFRDIPLTYSIKANPFLLGCLPENICHVEVCSPGELKICKAYKVAGSKIIYAGVNKEKDDIAESIAYGVDIITAESVYQVELIQGEAKRAEIKQKVILRLTSGNQFGMSEVDILSILSNQSHYPHLVFYGIHYYSGTQKKKREIDKDFDNLLKALTCFGKETGFFPSLVEVGPGLPVDYFTPPYDEIEEAVLTENKRSILAFAKKYPIGIEMGRYFAASCGTYATQIKDRKYNDSINYIICDGGIHHLKYYGQTMAMQVPEMEVLGRFSGETELYCICGSLCTVADVLVREVELPKVTRDDVLLFHRCGAYSVTEGSALFLSRVLPEVYLYSEKKGIKKLRRGEETADINTGDIW